MQAATNARPKESAFALRAPDGWEFGEGWLMVYALRWQGTTRRLAVPDSLASVFIGADGGIVSLSAAAAVPFLSAEAVTAGEQPLPTDDQTNQAKKVAQEVLREVVTAKRLGLRISAGISLLLVASIGRSI